MGVGSCPCAAPLAPHGCAPVRIQERHSEGSFREAVIQERHSEESFREAVSRWEGGNTSANEKGIHGGTWGVVVTINICLEQRESTSIWPNERTHRQWLWRHVEDVDGPREDLVHHVEHRHAPRVHRQLTPAGAASHHITSHREPYHPQPSSRATSPTDTSPIST